MTIEMTDLPERVQKWFGLALEAGASDLHLIAGYPPVLRLHGDLVELREPPLGGEEAHLLLGSLCRPEASARLAEEKDADLHFSLKGSRRPVRCRPQLFQGASRSGG